MFGNQWFRVTLWALSAVAMVAGFLIGFNINAPVGGYLLGASVILALVPFASHRKPN